MNTTVKELRSALKNCIQAELERLPKTLEGMEPKQRLDLLIKLLPYAMPKNDNVSASFGEPKSWDF
jgi:hypothetical protein